MEHAFWQESWDTRQIGFHNPKVHPMLAAHLLTFDLADDARICLPLCGKTLDIHWLLHNGFRVVGIELVESAVVELFDELELTPEVSNRASGKIFTAKNIDIFVGDIFDLTTDDIGSVDCVYDRAALVALPRQMRDRYTRHILNLTQNAPQLLIVFDYDQEALDGPPFSISSDEVDAHYGAIFKHKTLASRDLKGGLKGQCPAVEIARHLYV